MLYDVNEIDFEAFTTDHPRDPPLLPPLFFTNSLDFSLSNYEENKEN